MAAAMEEEEQQSHNSTKHGCVDQRNGHQPSMEEEKYSLLETKGEKLSAAERWASMICQPFTWVGMLCRDLNASFVLGVIATYGVSQGMGGAMYKVAGGFYWKDVQKVQPSAAQIYNGIIHSPWDVKPLWGMLTDLLPVAGYHYRPYFLLSGLLVFSSALILAFSSKLSIAIAISLLVATTAGLAIADVTIDAAAAKKSHEQPKLAADVQTLCATSESIGSLIGFLSSGYSVAVLSPKGALGLSSISGALFLMLAFSLHESHSQKSPLQAGKKVGRLARDLWKTLKCPQVWRPTLYMFLSWATSPSIGEAKFYWYTDSKLGLNFSGKFIGIMYAAGSVGGLFGTILYQKTLKTCSFRTILFWAQLLIFFGGMIDLVLVLRWNLKMHIPDSVFLLADDIFIRSVMRLKWIPQLTLCARLCPPGIEGTFFALLMSIDNVALLCASWSGGLMLHLLGVTRQNYDNLWLAALIRNVLRLFPISLLYLVPDCDATKVVIPPELANDIASETKSMEEDHMQLVMIPPRGHVDQEA